ncbi:MAG: serine/threonine protein kinase [Candidatus Xenobia bacterium]
MLGAGTVLDNRFRIEEIIGRGGMGAVYRAIETHSNKNCAIKELLVHIENPSERDSAMKQFKREAEMLVRLRHDGIPEMMGYFMQGENAYLAMEFVEGITMEAIVCENEELPTEAQALEWAIQLCEVLEYLHDLSPPIIFRDLKPSNVMISSSGHVKLIDFGIAKNFDPVYVQTASYLKGSGTPGYAPMEQYGKGSTDPRSDVYSLGATLYFVLTGRDPPQSVDIASGVDVLVPPRAYNPEISPALEEVILKMMAIRKEERYQSASDAGDALRSVRHATNQGGGLSARIPTVNNQPHVRTATLEIMPGTHTGETMQWRREPEGERARPSARPKKSAGGGAGKAVLMLLLVAMACLGLWRLLQNPPWPARYQVAVRVSDPEVPAVQQLMKLDASSITVRHAQEDTDGWTLQMSAGSSPAATLKEVNKVAVVSLRTSTEGARVIALKEPFLHRAEALKAQRELERKGIHMSLEPVTTTRAVVELVASVGERDKAEDLRNQLASHKYRVTFYEPQ